VTKGRIPVTGEPAAPCAVLYLSAENSPEYVVRPRFDLLGGDATRFHVARDAVTLSDSGALSAALDRTEARLLIVDPVQSFLGAKVDMHRSNSTRPVLDGLARIAEDHNCCVLLIRHMTKGTGGKGMYRGLGSIDLTGAVRSELLVGLSPDDASQRAMVQVKSNLDDVGPALGYTVAGGKFAWTGESDLTESDLLTSKSTGSGRSALDRAVQFLVEQLAEGKERTSTEIDIAAKDKGISAATLRRAREKAGVGHRQNAEKHSILYLVKGRSVAQDTRVEQLTENEQLSKDARDER
jgi:DNA repair protein RadA/Sms